MQAKHLIVIAVLGILALIVFNLTRSPTHDVSSEFEPAVAEPSVTAADETIANKPLGQQPKAIVDKASAQIEQAQQVERDRMAQISSEVAQ